MLVNALLRRKLLNASGVSSLLVSLIQPGANARLLIAAEIPVRPPSSARAVSAALESRLTQEGRVLYP